MTTNRNATTFSSTYKDDWDKDDHYHRILFNNGRALQARELTQMQTIIQEEMASFGRNIFKEGSAINSSLSVSEYHVVGKKKLFLLVMNYQVVF